mgnify:CR=1 FL=1
MEIASLTEPDPLPDVEIEVRMVEAPDLDTWCFLCGNRIENYSGPGVFLKGGWERACRQCARVHDPVVLNELKWRRADWKAAMEETRDE